LPANITVEIEVMIRVLAQRRNINEVKGFPRCLCSKRDRDARLVKKIHPISSPPKNGAPTLGACADQTNHRV
jgi:hypothetical protein